MNLRLKKRVNITIPGSLHRKAQARAAQIGAFDGNFSAYLRELIERDLARAKASGARSRRR